MKKFLKWFGITFLVLIACLVGAAFLGKNRALHAEISDVDLMKITDGTYRGTFNCYRFTNQVEVTVSDHAITDIVIVKTQNGRESISEDLAQQVVKAQTPALDAISGATADKKAFLAAVEIALNSAIQN